jgi:hypothetical protein
MRNAILLGNLAIASCLAISTVPAFAQAKRIDSSTAFGCQSKDHYRKLIGIAVSGDDAAFVKGMQSAIGTGQCVVFKNQQQVFLEEFEITTGLAQVRPAGGTRSYWTSNSTIK